MFTSSFATTGRPQTQSSKYRLICCWGLFFLANMLLMLLLQFIYTFQSSSEARHEALCTSDTCFTLHHEELSFERAQKDCHDNGGNLMTLRDKNEESKLLELIRTHHSKRFKVWIGLKRSKKDCMLLNETFKGFKWISGEEDSQYSNWKKKPSDICLERCVKVDYTAADPNQLKWIETSCKSTALYACKFYFRGMCRPLSLLGTGNITYTPPFTTQPLKSEIKLLPIGTYALISCGKPEPMYSVCQKISNTYNWTNPGPFCQLEKQNCGINNGGCEHSCQEDADGVRCFCKEGFELEDNGFSCRTKDLCGPDSCEHQCMTGESGIICSCPNGFRLNGNQRNCSDIDECQSEACGDRVCVNAPGSYTCVCEDGYDMIDGDCRLCAQLGCEYGCLNDNGSFSCYCGEGFILSQDGHSCVDIDLCASNPCLSDFTCINTVGSFICTHQPKTDKSTETPTHMSVTPAAPSDVETQDFTESLTRTTVELQHPSPHTSAPQPDLVNVTDRDQSNPTLAINKTKSSISKLLICVLGSVIPLVLLVTLTLFIIVFRCSRTKKEVKKKTSVDGYCWVSPGLDPRLEKLYESILTDDL